FWRRSGSRGCRTGRATVLSSRAAGRAWADALALPLAGPILDTAAAPFRGLGAEATMTAAIRKRGRTRTLDFAYEESGRADGAAVVLLHGFPYDPRGYDALVAPLVGAGCRVIV